MKPLFVIKPPRHRRRSRGPAGYLFLLALVIGVVLAWGNATDELPPFEGELSTFAPVPSVDGLEVCWIETASAKLLDATAAALVIRHPKGTLLVDAGNSSRFQEDVAPVAFPGRLFLWLAPGMLRPALPLPARLASLGVDPASLMGVIPTHAHVDHVGGLLDLPAEVAAWLPAEELSFAKAEAAARSIHVMTAHAERIAARSVPLALALVEGGPFERSMDVFGDGSVQVVSMPGHTPGSVGVFVSLSPERRLLLAGDAINRVEEITPARTKRAVMARSDKDATAAHAMVSRLARLKQLDPELVWLPAHQRSAWVRAFGAPGRCLPAREGGTKVVR